MQRRGRHAGLLLGCWLWAGVVQGAEGGEAAGQDGAVEAPPGPAWAATAGAALIALNGNARALTLQADVKVERSGAQWIESLRASGSYGRASLLTPEGTYGDAQTVALAASLQLRSDRRLSPRVSLYGLGGVDTDHVKSVEYRGYGEVGTGLYWVGPCEEGAECPTSLRTDVAARFTRESRFQYYATPLNLEDESLLGPRLALELRQELRPGIRGSLEAEALPNVVGVRRLVANVRAKLAVGLTKVVALSASLQGNLDSEPAPGRRSVDTTLSLGLEASL